MLSTPKYAGEPSVESLASGLATLGRYGDEYMVHAAHGETVIPKEILDSNPQLKQDLFRQMMMMGIRDPNRYVVGSSLNSINPVTGQPEFFFKKVFKAVKKVFKKALPIVAQVAGNYLLPGIGGIIAAGLVTKLQGGSWGDALKSAGISWATQGLMSGVSGAMAAPAGGGWSGFTSGLSQGLTAPITAVGKLTGSGGIGSFFSGSSPTAAAAKAGSVGTTATATGGAGIESFGEGVDVIPDDVLASSVVQPGGIPTGAGPGDDLFAESFGSGIRQPDVARLIAPPRPTNFANPAFAGNPVLGQNINAGAFPSPEDLQLAEADAAARQFLTSPLIGREFPGAPVDVVTANQSIVGPGKYSGYPANVPAAAPGTTVGSAAGDPSELSSTTYRLAGIDPAGGIDLAGGTAPVQKTDLGGLESFKRTLQQGSPFADYQHTLPDGSEIYGQRALLESRRVAVENATNLMAGKVEKGSDLWNQTIKEAMERGTSEATPSMLQKYGPIAGIGSLAYGVFSEDEEELRNKNLDAASEEMTAYNEWKKIGDKNSPEAQALYFKWHGQPNRTRSQFEYLTGGPSGRPDWMFLPEEYRAMGGEVIGPGTGTSDSIPARLSDGEFVMTADAVRNAGGGDRNLGAARMYDMMRRFEGGTA